MTEMHFTDQVGEWQAVLGAMIEREAHPYRHKKLVEIREALKRLRADPSGDVGEEEEESGFLALGLDHGCLTGDCPNDGHDCVAMLREHIEGMLIETEQWPFPASAYAAVAEAEYLRAELARLRRTPETGPHCHDCGEPHWYNVWVDDEAWSLIAPVRGDPPGGGGVLCARCIDRRCQAHGMEDVVVQFHWVGEVARTRTPEPEKPPHPVDWAAYHEWLEEEEGLLREHTLDPETEREP